MCRPYGWVFGPKFSKQGFLFGRFSINMGGLSRNWRKIAKNGPFSAKTHHRSGCDSKFWLLEEGTFLKTGRQTPSICNSCTPRETSFLSVRLGHVRELWELRGRKHIDFFPNNVVWTFFWGGGFHSRRFQIETLYRKKV